MDGWLYIVVEAVIGEFGPTHPSLHMWPQSLELHPLQSPGTLIGAAAKRPTIPAARIAGRHTA